MEVADTVVLMNGGRVEQVGTPEEVYQQPATPFVYQFLGDVNTFKGQAQADHAEIGGLRLRLERPASTSEQPASEQPATLYARPHELSLARVKSAQGGIEARLRAHRRVGGMVRLELERADGEGLIEAELSRDEFVQEAWREGERVWVWPQNPRVFLGTLH